MRVRLSALIIGLVAVLILSGIPNAMATSSVQFSGNILHVWSHSTRSSYTEIHDVNRALSEGDIYTIEQVVMATNYSGSAGVVLLEVQAKRGTKTVWYSFYWFGGDQVYAGDKAVPVDMSVPHRYKIEVTRDCVKFYIDGNLVNTVTGVGITKIEQINAGRWDKKSEYDMYIDDVKEFWDGELIASENFDDGKDDFYTDDVMRGRRGSGEEIVSIIQVPEFPFLDTLIDAVSKVL